MSNKQELIKQYHRLQKEMDKLKIEIHKSEDLQSRIKSYSDVCEELGIKELTIEDFKQFGTQAKKLFNIHCLGNITELFNEGVKIDFSNPDQRKYYNWWEYKNGGWVFVGVYCLWSFSGLPGVSYFIKEEDAKFCAKTFYDVCTGILE